MAPLRDPAAARPAPREVPSLMVRRGQVVVPSPTGPVPLRDDAGLPVDAFDAFDRLVPQNRRVYIVDLDGVERNQPQLDLWPELARDADLWIDAGVPVADQAIDVLVSGARRAVLSTARLRGPGELTRAWGLSQELAFEIETHGGVVPSGPTEWAGRRIEDVAQEARKIGPSILVLSPRDEEVDWDLVRRIAADGPTWVAGSYPIGSLGRVAEAQARGGIYHPEARTLLPSAAP